MNNLTTFLILGVVALAAWHNALSQSPGQNKTLKNDNTGFMNGFSEVNGIRMYYEIHGSGHPLVLIHGGGSTIETTFGRILPQLARRYTVIAMDLQNHGRSGFRDTPQTFEQDADDVVTLLKNLGFSKASFLGFSNGGTTAFQVAIRYPKFVDRLVLASAAFKRDGMVPGFFDQMQQATLADMPRELKEAFLRANPDQENLQRMFEKDRDRMIAFTDLTDDQVRSVKVPVLLISGDRDVVTPEHAVAMFRLIPNCQLAVIPGGHGGYLGEIATLSERLDTSPVISLINSFLRGS